MHDALARYKERRSLAYAYFHGRTKAAIEQLDRQSIWFLNSPEAVLTSLREAEVELQNELDAAGKEFDAAMDARMAVQ